MLLGSILISFSRPFLKKPAHCSSWWLLLIYLFTKCGRVLFFPHFLQHLLFVNFWTRAIVNQVRKSLTVVLICMSLIFNDVDIFSWDSFKGCELNLPLEIDHLNTCLVLIFFQWHLGHFFSFLFFLGHFLKAGIFYLQPFYPCAY